MIIIGCDYHPGFQQIAWLDTDRGELQERRLVHRDEALEQMVERRPVTRQLSTHPGVGPLTALAFELVIGTPERFASALSEQNLRLRM
jgi:transposase